MRETLDIDGDGVVLRGDLEVPDDARAIVVFAHGSGSSRRSPRNMQVAAAIRASGTMGTLLFDLLTPGEDAVYANRFDIPLLARRLSAASAQLLRRPEFAEWPIGYFGASTGAAAAIIAAADDHSRVHAVVSRGGRPDLAGEALGRITTPTLLIVGGLDHDVLVLNKRAFDAMPAHEKRLDVVPGATHLFEEPGTLAAAANLAVGWFERFLVTERMAVGGRAAASDTP